MGTLRVEIENREPVRLAARFEAGPGELVALVGPSGSGKTTLLRAIAGLVRADAGRVAIGDTVWFDRPGGAHGRGGVDLRPQQRRVGMVFQHYALFPHLSALQNVALAIDGTLGRSAGTRERAAALLTLLALTGLEHRLPAALSGGQQQRVALARALARDPAVLLLDEPFSAVDQVARQALYGALAELRRSLSVPIVLVTHDLAEARLLADRLVILDRGETLQSGPPLAVLSSPRNARVADLVGIDNHFRGVFQRAVEGEAHGWIRWGRDPAALVLSCRDKGRIRDGQDVTWVVAGEYLSLRTASHAGENSVAGRIEQALVLGEITRCRVRIDAPPHDAVVVYVPPRFLRRHELGEGSPVRVQIDPAGIHVMPAHPGYRSA